MENCEPPPIQDPNLPQDNHLSRDVYALLAQANLFRMRGCWEEATENCMAALRLTPDSHSAQSLLGDIYENQGRFDDAAQWYRMALDLNPGSPADRIKLDRLLHQEADPSRVRSLPNAPGEQASGQVEAGSRFTLKPEAALRAAAVAAALLVLLVVASAYVSLHRRSAFSALGLSSDQEVMTRPVVVPLTGSSDPPPAPSALRDASEQSILDALRSSQSLSGQGIVVYDVAADPRGGRLELTYGLTPDGGGNPSREAALRSGLRLVQAASLAAGAQPAVQFTVRFLMPLGSGSGPTSAALVFVGDVSRASVPAATPADAGLTAAQVQALFSNPWWSPQFPG